MFSYQKPCVAEKLRRLIKSLHKTWHYTELSRAISRKSTQQAVSTPNNESDVFNLVNHIWSTAVQAKMQKIPTTKLSSIAWRYEYAMIQKRMSSLSSKLFKVNWRCEFPSQKRYTKMTIPTPLTIEPPKKHSKSMCMILLLWHQDPIVSWSLTTQVWILIKYTQGIQNSHGMAYRESNNRCTMLECQHLTC